MRTQNLEEEKSGFRLKYQELLPSYTSLKDFALADLETLFKGHGLQLSKVEGRIKEFDSLYNKYLTLKRKGLVSSPLEVQDILGIRVVCLFVKDLDNLEQVLSPTFKILSQETKGSKLKDNEFGYESDHYILAYNAVNGPRYELLKNITFELQVRTILMDAWACVSHNLDYKSAASIPSHLKRVFFGLSGMFVVADKTFQDLKQESIKNQADQEEKIDRPLDLLSEELNLDSLKAYLQYKFPERWTALYGKSPGNSDVGLSEFLAEAASVGGYTRVSDLDEAVDAAKDVEADFEKSDFPGDKTRALVGTLRSILDLYDDAFYEMRIKDLPTNFKTSPLYLSDMTFRAKMTQKKKRS